MLRIDDQPVPNRRVQTTVPVSRNGPDAPPSHLTEINHLNGDPSFMTSFARGLAVIQAFSSRRRRMTISQLSLRTGFSRAAVRRCLYTLVKLGFADTEDTHYFYLRPRILSLGYSFINSVALIARAQPILEQMSHHSFESCWIGICMLEDQEAVCVAHANAARLMSLDVRVGSRVPAFCTAVGQVLLANLPREEQESSIAQTRFVRYTKHTVSTAARLRHVLSLVERNGYAVVDHELEIGVCALAVPIRDLSGEVVAALGVAALSQRVSSEKSVMKILARMREGAQDLSMLLK